MSLDIFHKLRDRLDEMSIGFPAVESGAELQLLQKMFDQDEAELFLHLGLKLELPEKIAARIGRDPNLIRDQLHQMAEKGLVYRQNQGNSVMYRAQPFIMGIFEFQLGRMDKEFAELYEKYWEDGAHKNLSLSGSLHRPIPVKGAIDPRGSVGTHEDCRDIIRNQKLISVANCICRTQKIQVETACDKPLEVCLAFGDYAQAFMDLGIARKIEIEEALEIQDKAEEAGLVPQLANIQAPLVICNCCGDCCGSLRSINLLPKPAEAVLSNYYATIDPELCTSCEACLERCQMQAIDRNGDSVFSINLDRCIGCGLCVTACPVEACRLNAKPDEKRQTPPQTLKEMMSVIADKRGIPLARVFRNK